MRATTGSRARYLLAPAFLGASAAAGCSGGGEPSVPVPVASDPVAPALERRCGDYRGLDNAFGYCLFTSIREVEDPEAVDRACALAGEWEPECRHAWVSWKLPEESGTSTQTLLQVCGDASDCAFEVVDVRADPVLGRQLARCKRYAGEHGPDCAGHAAEQWWIQDPDPEEVARVAALEVPFPERVAFFLAASVVCRGVGSCDGHPELQAACEAAAETFRRDRMRCPYKARPVPLGGAAPRESAHGASPPAGPPGDGD